MSERQGAGRPVEFLPSVTLEQVMRLFWEKGYQATSMQDLEACTGLGRSSLYNTFGSKRDLYLRAMARYQEMLGEVMFVSLEKGRAGLDDVHAFFGRLRGGLSLCLVGGDKAIGCLMINSMIEFGGQDPALAQASEAAFGRLVKAMRQSLARAARLGEIQPRGLDAKAQLLMTLALGINVKARSGAAAAQVARMVDAAHDQVRAWRLP